MQHRGDQTIKKSFLQLFQEVFLVEVIGDFAIHQILELVCVLQIIHRDDVVLAALVECLDQIGTDKSGCAGDDVIHMLFSYNFRMMGQRE